MPRMFNPRLREVRSRGMAASPGDLPGLVLGKAEEKRSDCVRAEISFENFTMKITVLPETETDKAVLVLLRYKTPSCLGEDNTIRVDLKGDW